MNGGIDKIIGISTLEIKRVHAAYIHLLKSVITQHQPTKKKTFRLPRLFISFCTSAPMSASSQALQQVNLQGNITTVAVELVVDSVVDAVGKFLKSKKKKEKDKLQDALQKSMRRLEATKTALSLGAKATMHDKERFAARLQFLKVEVLKVSDRVKKLTKMSG